MLYCSTNIRYFLDDFGNSQIASETLLIKVCLSPSSSKNIVSTVILHAGKLHLNDAAKLFDPETLRQMKKGCGGLQTVLRNCHQVFEGG